MPYTLNRRDYYRTKFEGSERLFYACWKEYQSYLNGAIDNPKSDDDVLGWLDSLAAQRVNNPHSSFYINGL